MTSSHGNNFRVTGHLCGEFTGHRWIPAQRPVTRSFDVLFDLHPNKRLSKQWWAWKIETPSRPLWRHCNVSSYWVKFCGRFAGHRPRNAGSRRSIKQWRAWGLDALRPIFTETEMSSSFWSNFHNWLHQKLSKWQLPVQSVMKILSEWRYFLLRVMLSWFSRTHANKPENYREWAFS